MNVIQAQLILLKTGKYLASWCCRCSYATETDDGSSNA